MKIIHTSKRSANRFNDWFAYQRFAFVGSSISKNALLRSSFVEVPPTPLSSSKSSVPRLSWWKRFVLWFKSLFRH